MVSLSISNSPICILSPSPCSPFCQGNINPLHLSVESNHRQITVILCQHGCDPNHQDITGSSPLHFVKSKTVLKVLLRFGGDPRLRNHAGETPREHYLKATEGYLQDLYLIKRLLQVEEAYHKEDYKKQLNELQIKNSDDTVAKTTRVFNPLT
jgi:ankyrin repeat protein